MVPEVRKLRGLEELVRELRALLPEIKDAEGKPFATGDVGGGVGGEFARINRDGQTRAVASPTAPHPSTATEDMGFPGSNAVASCEVPQDSVIPAPPWRSFDGGRQRRCWVLPESATRRERGFRN